MVSKTIATVVLAYFVVALLILLSGFFFSEESHVPTIISLISLIPLYFWKRNYERKVELSKEVDGKGKGSALFWVFALFILALAVRIPSVLLFDMPYEKAPLIYLLILTMMVIERVNASAFGFKTQRMGKALFYGTAFYIILGGIASLTFYLLIYAFAGQTPISSFNAMPFLMAMPFQTLLVGISEEGLFRGYIQTRLKKFYAGKAVIIQAVLFGFWHFVWNINPFDPWGMTQYITTTFVIGLLFGYFYSKSRNLVPLVLAHGLWNSIPSGMAENPATFELLKQTLLFNQLLIWLLPYTIAVVAAFFFVKYLVKEI